MAGKSATNGSHVLSEGDPDKDEEADADDPYYSGNFMIDYDMVDE